MKRSKRMKRVAKQVKRAAHRFTALDDRLRRLLYGTHSPNVEKAWRNLDREMSKAEKKYKKIRVHRESY